MTVLLALELLLPPFMFNKDPTTNSSSARGEEEVEEEAVLVVELVLEVRGEEEGAEEEGAEVEKKKIVLGRIQTWRLRCSVVVAVLALVAASVVGLLSNGKMCFHPEDMVTSEQKEWCETGRVLMTSK